MNSDIKRLKELSKQQAALVEEMKKLWEQEVPNCPQKVRDQIAELERRYEKLDVEMDRIYSKVD